MNSTKSLTQNVERITPAITFWTSSVLNTREREEIASGGFGIHEERAQRVNEDGENQDGETEIPSTQLAVKLEIDEEGIKKIIVK